MGYEAIVLPSKEATSTHYTYEIIDTPQPVQAAFEEILASGVDQVALVIIKLYYEQDARLTHTTQSSAYLLSILRPMVRKTDCVFLQSNALYFVLRGSNQQGGSIVETRLWEALLWHVHNMTEREFLRPASMTIGHSGYQESNASIEESIEAADFVSLRYNWQAEKPSRKPLRHHQAPLQAAEEDTELPALARKLGIPYLTLLPHKLPAGVQCLVNPSLAQELRCFPIGRERNTLTVAMQNPQDNAALDRLHEETGLFIFPVLAPPRALQLALEQLV
jgi:Type II secretion system (T2SS), protein E, N-terminal domain